MSGEVQPRRRRDKKKKRAQLEALAKEEWEEGTALYGAEQEAAHEDGEEAVETIRDSSSGEEEEPLEDPTTKISLNYKIIFFVLLILLGAIASLVLIDIPTGDIDLESSTRVEEVESNIGSNFVPETGEGEWGAAVKQDEDGGGIDGPEGIEYGDEKSFLESIGGFLNDYLEGEPTPEIHPAEAVEESMKPNESESNMDEVEEEFEEIMEGERIEDEEPSTLSGELGEKVIPTHITEPEETQLEHPLDMDDPLSSHQWQSTYPGAEVKPQQKGATDNEGEIYEHMKEMTQSESSSPTPDPTNSNQLKSEDSFDFTQHNSKSDGSVQNDEIFVDGTL